MALLARRAPPPTAAFGPEVSEAPEAPEVSEAPEVPEDAGKIRLLTVTSHGLKAAQSGAAQHSQNKQSPASQSVTLIRPSASKTHPNNLRPLELHLSAHQKSHPEFSAS